MALPKNYRKATTFERCGNCFFLDTKNSRYWCRKWDAFVELDHTCNAWKGRLHIRKGK